MSSEHLPAPHPGLYNLVLRTSDYFLRLSGGVEVTGTENLVNIDSGYILTPPHSTWKDIPVIGVAVDKAVNAQVHFMAKEELEDHLYWKVVAACGGFTVNRATPIHEQTDVIQHVRTLDEGKAVQVNYVQGTRIKGPLERKDLKTGVANLALTFGLPLVPVGYDSPEKGTNKIHVVAFGDKIQVENKAEELAACDMEVLKGVRQYKKLVKSVMDELFKGMVIAQSRAIEYQAELLDLRS